MPGSELRLLTLDSERCTQLEAKMHTVSAIRVREVEHARSCRLSEMLLYYGCSRRNRDSGVDLGEV